jgi:hypothetical protein
VPKPTPQPRPPDLDDLVQRIEARDRAIEARDRQIDTMLATIARQAEVNELLQRELLARLSVVQAPAAGTAPPEPALVVDTFTVADAWKRYRTSIERKSWFRTVVPMMIPALVAWAPSAVDPRPRRGAGRAA